MIYQPASATTIFQNTSSSFQFFRIPCRLTIYQSLFIQVQTLAQAVTIQIVCIIIYKLKIYYFSNFKIILQINKTRSFHLQQQFLIICLENKPTNIFKFFDFFDCRSSLIVNLNFLQGIMKLYLLLFSFFSFFYFEVIFINFYFFYFKQYLLFSNKYYFYHHF
ncbi:transmembrane protein, putative (macronuclear) [Tetrahymena thermophila SB210]|uniref:Transmembrane protein, putative n=1 Tax=Tetrahymena thermophila (strain SB210) TaxID=312017 RepID=W7XF43_TETTS|nr:transmembrane protein, putative [Tetrahymena thermophila SB210]EWS75413.1 transmembrane protein, putative [Tetrahymena thermophila SB210]|eukprot:XP_012652087.1 transmembrane protein, putative [Tetrahymena thermophila SB210]